MPEPSAATPESSAADTAADTTSGTTADTEAAKRALRKAMLTRRCTLSPEEALAHARQAQLRVIAHPVWKAARQVLLYKGIRNELSTDMLLDAAWQSGKQVLLPRCEPDAPGTMCLAPCACAADLTPGLYGIPEPCPVRCPALDPDSPDFRPDIAIIPGVAFDRHGNRLGYGGGYYDRFLAHPGMARTALVGFAHAFQIVDALPAAHWDRPVHALCTEEDFLWL